MPFRAPLLVVVLPLLALALAACGHALRPEALLTDWGSPCEQVAVTVAQFGLACDNIGPAAGKTRCYGAIAEASSLQRLRYCARGASQSDCSPATCQKIGDYWFADEECIVAAFGPPPPAELKQLLRGL